MSHLTQVKSTKQTYENLYAVCPSCGRENIFNRATDLKRHGPIGNTRVQCHFPDCLGRFRLYGDLMSPAYAMLINDCYELMQAKHYAYCILNLAQAYEVFFSQYLRVQFLYRPAAAEFDRGNHNVSHLNDLRKLLYQNVKKLTFAPLRNLFVNTTLRGRSLASLSEAENDIREFSKNLSEPSKERIRKAGRAIDDGIVALLLGLMVCKTTELRNDVVHKLAYRPTLQQVNRCLKETKGLLSGLAGSLNVHFDHIEAYRAR